MENQHDPEAAAPAATAAPAAAGGGGDYYGVACENCAGRLRLDNNENEESYGHGNSNNNSNNSNSNSNSNSKLYGREAELRQLKLAWDDVAVGGTGTGTGTAAAGACQPRLVLIRGYAGTGKTRLVETFLQRAQQQQQQQQQRNCDPTATSPPLLVSRGKFDRDVAAEPFSVLAAGLSDLCRQFLSQESEEEVAAVRSRILEAVGSEGRALTNAIPALEGILGRQPELNDVSMSKAKNRLVFLFRAFVRTICSERRPVLFFLDDLQWADAPTLSLVTALVVDPALKHCLFVGAYRDNEVDSSHPLAEHLDAIRESGTATFLSLEIGNLDLPTTTLFVADVLRLDPVEVCSFAKALFVKTGGNIYYTRVSLLLLAQTGILRYSYATFKWEWDLPRLNECLGVSQNVVDVTIQSLKTLPAELQRTLSIAAFMRSSFDLSTLQHLLAADQEEGEQALVGAADDQHDATSTTSTAVSLEELLAPALMVGLVQKVAGTAQKYRFVHDRIREAALALLPAAEKDRTTLRIGKCLLRLSSSSTASGDSSCPTCEEWAFFAGIDNINSLPVDIVMGEFDLRELVELNHTAGAKAVSRYAFLSASVYLQKALELISKVPSRLESDYDISLKLHVLAANVDFCIGNFDRAQESLDEVLSTAKSERDKLQAYVSLAEGLGLRERHEDALEVDLKAVAIISDFPKRFLSVHLMKDMTTIKTFFRNKTDEQILSMPLLLDEDKLLALKILSYMISRAYLSKKMIVSLLCMTRSLCITLRGGLSPAGALVFSQYAALLCGPLEDHKLGIRLGQLSHKIKELTGGREFESKILFSSAVHVDAWVMPLARVQYTLDRAYRAGMETGDSEFALFSSAYYNLHAFMIGLPLSSIIDESQSLLHQINEFGVETVRVIAMPFHQMLIDLSGRSEDPLAWIKATSEGLNSKRSANHKPSETLKLIFSYMCRGQLAYYLGQVEAAEKMWIKLKPLLVGISSYSAPTLNMYFSGLIGTAMFRKTGKRKYRIQALKATQGMKSLMEKFNTGLNNLHRYYIMKADCKATFGTSKNNDEVRKVYDEAISAASKAGFQQDAALANELCGEFFVLREDMFWAKHYLGCACRMYETWGADAKVDQMKLHRRFFLATGEDDSHPRSRKLQRSSLSRKAPHSAEPLLVGMMISLDDSTGEISDSASPLCAFPKASGEFSLNSTST